MCVFTVEEKRRVKADDNIFTEAYGCLKGFLR